MHVLHSHSSYLIIITPIISTASVSSSTSPRAPETYSPEHRPLVLLIKRRTQHSSLIRSSVLSPYKLVPSYSIPLLPSLHHHLLPSLKTYPRHLSLPPVLPEPRLLTIHAIITVLSFSRPDTEPLTDQHVPEHLLKTGGRQVVFPYHQ